MLRYFLSEKAKGFVPPREGDAGFDITCCEDVDVAPGEIAKISTGLHISLESGWVAIVKDRSSVASRGGSCMAGVIDASYRGEVLVLVKNQSEQILTFKAGDKIAQLLVLPHLTGCKSTQVSTFNELGETERGAAGFGSTGT